MRAMLIYDTEYGNTEKVARAIASGLGPDAEIQVRRAGDPLAALAEPYPDLLLVGGPTQRHGLSPTLRGYLDTLPRRALAGLPAATFDTRYRMSPLLSGSAARQAAGRLRRAGCRMVAEPESFFVERQRPPDGQPRAHDLERPESGELERAVAWGRRLASAS